MKNNVPCVDGTTNCVDKSNS